DARRAVIRFEQGGEDSHDRGLAGAVGAEQREDASARHVEVHTLEHMQFLIGLLQSMDLDRHVLLFHASCLPIPGNNCRADTRFPGWPPGRLWLRVTCPRW